MVSNQASLSGSSRAGSRDPIALDRFKEAMLAAFGDAIRKPISVALGYTDDTGASFLKVPDEDTDQPNKYYFHELGGQPFQGQAFLNEGVLSKKEIRYNMPVRVERDKLNKAWVITGRDPLYGSEYLGNVDDPPVVVNSDQITIGLLTETVPQSMQARVLSGAYTNGLTWKYIDTQLTIDFTDFIPTTNGRAVYVLVQVEYDTGLADYKFGAEISSAPTFIQIATMDGGTGTLLPQTDNGFFRSGYVKLVAGMTVITKSVHIFALQEFLYHTSAASVLSSIVTACREVVVDSHGEVVWVE